MKELVESFSKQLTEAIAIGEKARVSKSAQPIQNVLICGLGGSGIGGSIVSELVAAECSVPITVSKGYFIPAFVSENTLVIVSSYSGNTEESVNCLELAAKKKAKIACITSGGKIEEMAKAGGHDLVLIPGGMPPRACLGYSLTQLFFVLHGAGLIGNAFKEQLKKAVQLIDAEEKNIIAEAKTVADKLNGKTPVIYATTYSEGIAIRFRQQLNENSKMLCWHHVIPEMNHNELVGWREKNDKLCVVIFRDQGDYSRNQARIEINKEVFGKYTTNIIEIWSKGGSDLEKAIYLIHLGDWISIFLAELRGYDANEIAVINQLKGTLAKL